MTNNDATASPSPAAKIPRSVLVAPFTPDRLTLLMERADFPGFWQSVTGSQESGESFAETAVREVQEETGYIAAEYGGVIDLNFENVFLIYARWRHRYPPGTTHNRERCFALRLAAPLQPRLAEREHVHYLWLPIHEAVERVYSWSNAAALRQLSLQI